MFGIHKVSLNASGYMQLTLLNNESKKQDPFSKGQINNAKITCSPSSQDTPDEKNLW